MVMEYQTTITHWAESTFGRQTSNLRTAIRINDEMAELLKVLAIDDTDPKALEELADIFIVGYTLAGRMGADIHEAINKKMAINRARKWKLDGTGCGQHL